MHFWYIYDILQAEVFCDAWNAPNSFFRQGGPAGGAHVAPPDPLVGWGGRWEGGYPLAALHYAKA